MATTQHRDSLTRERANELIRAWDARPGTLGSLLGRVTAVDQVGVEERVEALRRRSIKKASKLWALDLAIRMIDLTTLEGKDTPGKVRALCAKAIHPLPGDPTIPSVAAVCVYPALVAEAKEALAGSSVRVASVATGFPSGQTFREVKIAETRAALDAGADEIDMVIDRGAFLAGDYRTVFEEIVEVKEAAGPAHLKVILETGELETYDNVRRASVLAMAAGADFIKTSTGKVQPAATLPVTLVMLEAIRDFERQTGRLVGMKPAGGIRTAKEAIQYLVVLYETLGPRWMTPELFRFGASSLLNDVLMQIEKERTGRYQGPDHFSLD
ncbi:MAG: deoxyribose-phosphate aldolase [Chloroflexota bacterium]